MVHNKNKTIINNKNIIQICGNIKRKRAAPTKKQQPSNFNSPAQHLYTRENPILYTPNSFPNSTALEDQSRRVRFINAMRDPESTRSPYSIFDNGSNTFEREGNTEGLERPPQPQIRPDEYFSRPRSLVRPVQRVELSSPFTAMSPLDRFHSPFQSAEDIDEEGEGEEEEESQAEEQQVSMPVTRFDSPNKTYVPFQSPYRPQQEAQLDEVIIGDEEAEQLADAKEREDAQALEDEYAAIREEEERMRIEKLKAAQRESRERLAKELERKKTIQAKFKAVTEKITEFISTGGGKVQKKSELKKEIKQLLNDPTFTEFEGNRNIGALADARKILAYLHAGSAQVLADIKLIEDDRIELDKHVRRQTPAGRANIHTLAGGAGGGGVVRGGEKAK